MTTDPIRQLATFIQLTSGIIIAIVCCLFFYIEVNNHSYTLNNNANMNAGFCGNVSLAENSESIGLGKQLFKANCAQCHNKNMKDDLTGPALYGVTERWKDYPRADLYNWIRNSQQMIAEKHPRAVSLYQEWNKTLMNSYPDLKDEDIDALLSYISKRSN